MFILCHKDSKFIITLGLHLVIYSKSAIRRMFLVTNGTGFGKNFQQVPEYLLVESGFQNLTSKQGILFVMPSSDRTVVILVRMVKHVSQKIG